MRPEPGRHPSPRAECDQPLLCAERAHGLAKGACHRVFSSDDTIDAQVHHATGFLGMPCRAVAHDSRSVMCYVRLIRGSPSTVSCGSPIRSRHTFRASSLLTLCQLIYFQFIGGIQCQSYIKLAGEIRQTAHRVVCYGKNPFKTVSTLTKAKLALSLQLQVLAQTMLRLVILRPIHLWKDFR